MRRIAIWFISAVVAATCAGKEGTAAQSKANRNEGVTVGVKAWFNEFETLTGSSRDGWLYGPDASVTDGNWRLDAQYLWGEAEGNEASQLSGAIFYEVLPHISLFYSYEVRKDEISQDESNADGPLREQRHEWRGYGAQISGSAPIGKKSLATRRRRSTWDLHCSLTYLPDASVRLDGTGDEGTRKLSTEIWRAEVDIRYTFATQPVTIGLGYIYNEGSGEWEYKYTGPTLSVRYRF